MSAETNVEFVTRLMETESPLMQAFVLEAIRFYSDACIAHGPEKFDTSFLSGTAWVALAEKAKKELDERSNPEVKPQFPILPDPLVLFIAHAERHHFRSVHDSGSNPKAMMFLNLARSYAGLPALTIEDLPVWVEAAQRYVRPPDSKLLNIKRWSIRNHLNHEVGEIDTEHDPVVAFAVKTNALVSTLRDAGYSAKLLEM